jgi:LytS/YehU family sensor histidine kinase
MSAEHAWHFYHASVSFHTVNNALNMIAICCYLDTDRARRLAEVRNLTGNGPTAR